MKGGSYQALGARPGDSGGDRSLSARIKARKKALVITAVVVGGLAFAAGWNPPTSTVHSFTEASNYNARRESGCTNSGEGCHGDDARLSDFNEYHPETECNTCHEYTGVGCIPCHAPRQNECTGCHDGTMEGASDCVRLGDSYPRGHYRESLHEAVGTNMDQIVVAAPAGEAKATCSGCHSRDLRAAHTGVPVVEGSDYGPDIGCAECHNDKKSGALEQVLTDWEQHRCEDCHGEDSQAPMHAIDVATPVDGSGDLGCGSTGDGCHSTNDLHALHPNNPATCSGAAVEGEPGCHDLQIQSHKPTATACGPGDGSCHPGYLTDDYSHTNDASVHTATAQGSALWTDAMSGVRLTCASCHSSDLGIEHRRPHVGLGSDACQECHNKDEATIRTVKDSWPDRETADACATCHDGKHSDVGNVHTAVQLNDTGAVSATGCVKGGCHSTADVRVLHRAVGCAISGCHSNTGAISGSKMTCGGPDTRSGRSCHSNATRHVGAHVTLEAGIAGKRSSACVACHGRNLFAVATGEHQGCSCHTYGEATSAVAECADCHKKAYAPHGFVDGVAHGEGWIPASGHNTTTYGRIGAKTEFDGSQGVTLKWESEISNPALPPTWEVEPGFQWATRPEGITSVTVGQTGTVTTDWEFPTVNVFWTPGDPDAPADALFLNKDSVVRCEDCHAGLSAAGPHGAADNWALDPDYPGDYSKGELTKRVNLYPSGIKLRTSFAAGTVDYTSGMNMICSKCHDLQNIQSGTTVNSPLPLISTGGDPFDHDGETFTPVLVGSTWRVYTDAAGHPSTLAAGGQAWSIAATGTVNRATVGSSNTAHSSHHQDNADGSPQCVNCHIGVPHGWKRPRLLVNTGVAALTGLYEHAVVGDEAPYLDPDHLGVARGNLTMDTAEDYTMPWYNYAGGEWVLTTTTTEADAVWDAARSRWTFPNTPSRGWSKIGMLTLSAVDNHPLNAGSVQVGNSAIPAGMIYDTGAAYWSKPSCQACNDHMGEDGIRIIDAE